MEAAFGWIIVLMATFFAFGVWLDILSTLIDRHRTGQNSTSQTVVAGSLTFVFLIGPILAFLFLA